MIVCAGNDRMRASGVVAPDANKAPLYWSDAMSQHTVNDAPRTVNPFVPLTIKSTAVVIHLTKGKSALVDWDDYPRTRQHKWHPIGPMKSGHWYAEGASAITLHRMVMRPMPDQLVDHINNNGLDCRRGNMRLADKGQNAANRHTRTRSSGLKGVHWSKVSKKFCAQIRFRGKRIYLGLFDSELDAALAYDAKAREVWGEFANTNFER